jgi:hypothetical protein
MTKFNPILKKPGELIRSEDWNKMQEDIHADFDELQHRLDALKDYVDNMEESATLLNMDSLVGKAYNLDESVPGEKISYDSAIVGLLTKQYLVAKGETGDICRFSVVSNLELLDYWSGAEKGDKKALEATFNYIDGTNAVVGELFVHDRSRLRPKGALNPYLEYLLSPNEYVWYRYRLINPNPEKEVLSVNFKNLLPDCTPRIGNVIHYRSKIVPRNVMSE